MKIGYITIFLFIFTFLMYCVNAQQKIFKNYTVNDGLISNYIRNVFQDSKGFMWFGTLEGVSRYDGNKFTNFTESKRLSHGVVNDFYETTDGRLYVALNNGSIDEILDDKVIPDTSNSSVRVNHFFKTPWNQVIALTDTSGLQYFSNGKITKDVKKKSNGTFFEAVLLSDTSFAAMSATFLTVFNKNLRPLSGLKITDNIYSESKGYKDSKGRFWIITSGQLKLITSIAGSNTLVLNSELPSSFQFLKTYAVNDIFEDEEGSIWCATSRGIVKINSNGLHQIFTTNDGLSSNVIKSVFQDREKNLWFATVVGLSKLVNKSGISLYPIENGVFSSDDQFILYPYKKDHFLVSTFQGTRDFDKETGIFSQAFKGNDDYFYEAVSNINPVILTGLNKSVTIDTHLMRAHTIPALSAPYNIRIAISDKAGNSFVNDIHSLFFVSEDRLHKILDYRVKCLLIDRNNNLWAGTWQNGLIRFKYKVVNKNIQILETKYFLKGKNIRSLFEDSNGRIWAGSRYHGVYCLSKNATDSFSILNLNQKDGLTSNFIKSIREDKNGNFWIAFFQGLDKLIPKNNKFQIFNFSRVNNFFTSIIGMEIDSDNIIWLASAEGIVRIKDGELEKSSALPVYITKIYSSDSTYSLHTNEIKFSYQLKNLQFEYSSPGYINEKQILYSYRLVGNNEVAWSQPDNQHTVSFAGLQPGTYQFQVKSLGLNGIWGKVTIVNFIVTPPFWQTWWFITIIALLLSSLAFILIRWRIKNLREIDKQKLKVQRLNADHYKSELELEQIINYFSFSLIEKNTVNDVLSDVAQNLIGHLGFMDCVIYLWNDDNTKMVKRASVGSENAAEILEKQNFDIIPGQGVVGFVIQSKEPVLISDTSADPRCLADDIFNGSEIGVPVIYNSELIGVIESKHTEKNFFTRRHLQILNTIATLMATKIKSIEAEQSLLHTQIKMYSINDQLSNAKLEALRSQMNPHFIFNCLNSIDALIHGNDKYNATTYLNKFAKLLRNILDSSRQNTVTLSKDVETLKLYIELEVLRHENKFKTVFNIDEKLLNNDYKVPPLIVQPFVENAILHGLKNKEGDDGILTVDIIQVDNKIKYTITDNGIGRKAAGKISHNKESHYGLQITSERIRLFNKEEVAKLHIADLYNNDIPEGTSVTIILNIA